ncbi:hypothetical protein pneo_cds_181 [Pandoravirus neocaledonia]|uniref:Uncharacterized protein n=1 Tax=Pandoravirus neocaledonia TaxID=2107708 RepID=A0A2U7UBE0_9VIRU|nr:hypothetical protein pneo_cds_181 [Pandoravirus neocaledonia]AVK75788.1 hypothetical protein pneo_cds_181 [Pandoravirus neocaledonia]
MVSSLFPMIFLDARHAWWATRRRLFLSAPLAWGHLPGARLSDCLFVDCHFTETVFVAASIAKCQLIACTMHDGARVDSRALCSERHSADSPL